MAFFTPAHLILYDFVFYGYRHIFLNFFIAIPPFEIGFVGSLIALIINLIAF